MGVHRKMATDHRQENDDQRHSILVIDLLFHFEQALVFERRPNQASENADLNNITHFVSNEGYSPLQNEK